MDDFILLLVPCLMGMLFYIAATLTHIRIQLASLNDKLARAFQEDDTDADDEQECNELCDDYIYIEDDGK